MSAAQQKGFEASKESDRARKSPAVKSLEKERSSRKDKEEELVTGLEDSFPASDPAAVTTPTKPGAPPENKST